MCSINHEKHAIFIHIPKNGGSYISDILSKYYGFKNYYLQRPDHDFFCKGKDKSVDKHENRVHGTFIYYKTSPYLNKLMGMTPLKWNSYFIFTFMRDPYDRIVSGWNYSINKKNISFENYLTSKVNDYDYWHSFMTQIHHIKDITGEVKVNFIGFQDNMETDLKIILQKIGFKTIIHKPFRKNEKKHDNYINYYKNESTIELVNKLFEEDFEILSAFFI